MPSFICRKCGWGTLVRSNVRLTPKHEVECRAVDACDARQRAKQKRQKEIDDAMRHET